MNRPVTMAGAACLAALLLVQSPAAVAETAPAPPRRTELGSRPSEVLMAKFTVSDIVRSYDFYTRVIGLKPAMPSGVPPQPAPTSADAASKPFIEVGFNYSGTMSEPFFVIMHRAGKLPARESAELAWVGFKVPDVKAVVERVRAAGFQVVREPVAMAASNVQIGIVRDPDGYSVELVQTGS